MHRKCTLTRRGFLTSAAALSSAASPATAATTDREFDITAHGARPNGADVTEAISKAIAACSVAGGGRVIVPAGEFHTGPIHLKSRVNLHLLRGATLKFSTDPKHYLPLVFTRFEGTELMGYSPLIYAFEQSGIAVTGEGTLDGQANSSNWWPWKGNARFGWRKGDPNYKSARDKLLDMAEKGVPVAGRVFGEGSYFRPQFIQPYRCSNVLIEGIRIVNSPMWEIHPVLSKDVTVRNVSIDSHGPNNDGCDPESCDHVLIEGCTFNTGDDCIAIKSGRNADGRRLHTPSRNITVRDCTMKDGHGGVSIGSEVSGGISDVLIENCRMDSPHLERALRIKSNSYRGGTVERVTFRDSQIGEVADAVLDIDFNYEEGAGGPHMPTVRDITLENISCRSAKRMLYLRGYKDDLIRGITLRNVKVDHAGEPNVIENVGDLKNLS